MKTLRRNMCACAIVVVFLFIANCSSLFSQDLKNATNQADYVVITPASYMLLADRLAAFRHLHDSFTTMVVPFDSVLAQFGTATSPDSALRSFIQYTLKEWQHPSPKYLVLAGNVNTIPSHREPDPLYPLLVNDDSLYIDHWFVEDLSRVTGSYGQAQAVLGRLPAWDSAGLNVMIEKQIAYDTSTVGAWCGRSLGLADVDSMAFNIFELVLNDQQSILAPVWHDTESIHINTSSPLYQDPEAFKEAWNRGASIMVYCGHANDTVLSATRYFTTSTVGSLTNGNRLPVCFLEGCNLRFDTRPSTSIPVHLLQQPGGGAVACVASAGPNYEQLIERTTASIFTHLIADPDQTAGMAFKLARNEDPESMMRRLTFLGDPAIRIKSP